MKTHIFYFLIVFSICGAGTAQPYFNKQIEEDTVRQDIAYGGGSLVYLNNKYYAVSRQRQLGMPDTLFFYKLNDMGDIEDSHSYVFQDSLFSFNFQSLKVIDENKLLIYASKRILGSTTTNVSFAHIFIVDTTGAILNERSFVDTNLIGSWFNSIQPTQDSGFLACGLRITPTNTNGFGWIMKLNKNLEPEWEDFINTNFTINAALANRVIPLDNNRFAISGFFTYWNSSVPIYRVGTSVVRIYDSQTGLISSRNFDENQTLGIRSMHFDSVNQNILLVSHDFDNSVFNTFPMKTKVTSWNITNDSINWESYTTDADGSLQSYSLTSFTNSNFSAFGHYLWSSVGSFRVFNQALGYFLKADTASNVISTRILQSSPWNLNHHFLLDFVKHDNGDHAFIGHALFGKTFDDRYQRSWLVRVDSNGCFGPGNCPPSLSIDKPMVNLTHPPKLYPNPSQNYFWLELDDLNETIEQIRLVDGNGKLVKVLQNHDGLSKVRISTEGLAKGSYIVMVETRSGVTWKLRMLKVE
jgi:hypothetical protein